MKKEKILLIGICFLLSLLLILIPCVFATTTLFQKENLSSVTTELMKENFAETFPFSFLEETSACSPKPVPEPTPEPEPAPTPEPDPILSPTVSNTPSEQETPTTPNPSLEPVPDFSQSKSECDEFVITVLNCDTGKIEEVLLEDFVLRSLAAEMTAYEDCMEALKAQAIAIRSYVIVKSQGNYSSHNGAMICTDYGHCMACKTIREYNSINKIYRDRYEQAVNETKGQILTYKGTVAWTYFHGCSYYYTESALSAFGTHVPYLVSVESPVLKNTTQQYNYTKKELLSKLFGSKKAEEILQEYAYPLGMLTKTDSGRVENAVIYGISVSGKTLRSKLNLNSTSITITYDLETELYSFVVEGSGHGVGMSQVGAQAYAKEGKTYEWILNHYYVGTELTFYTEN